MKKRDRFFLCTIIPMIVVFFLFHTFPLLKGVMYSFTNFRGFGDFDFIGLMNFKDGAGNGYNFAIERISKFNLIAPFKF